MIWLAIIIPFGVLYAAIYGPQAALFSELFEARVRYTGISFIYQFSGIVAGGMTPIIATALLHYDNNSSNYICLYATAIASLAQRARYGFTPARSSAKEKQVVSRSFRTLSQGTLVEGCG